ncbi:MAG: hypothetical protein Q8P18_30590 [Pseudomonadota bacterium]|nr:hypothetical protein [Pseudomonadota bacterium]
MDLRLVACARDMRCPSKTPGTSGQDGPRGDAREAPLATSEVVYAFTESAQLLGGRRYTPSS